MTTTLNRMTRRSPRCPFPRLVWRPDELAYDPARRFAVIDAIRAQYRPVVNDDGMLLLEIQQ